MAETVMCSRLLVNYIAVPHIYILKAAFPVKESDGNRVCHWKPRCVLINSHIVVKIVVS